MKGQEEKEVSFLRRRYLEITLSILFVGLVFVFAFTIENYFLCFYCYLWCYNKNVQKENYGSWEIGEKSKRS